MTTMIRRSAMGSVVALSVLPAVAMSSMMQRGAEIERRDVSEVDCALAAYRQAVAATAALSEDTPEAIWERHVDIELDAIAAILAAPCRTPDDVRAKVRAIQDNEAISDVMHGSKGRVNAFVASLALLGC